MRASSIRGTGTPSVLLRQVRTRRILLEDFRPLAESLEWRLGQQYYLEKGNAAFLSDAVPIPFMINNDGNLSFKSAQLLFESLLESDRHGNVEDVVHVLEIGIGVGLFARYFLDRFREICAGSGKDYYDRLCYWGTDRSEKMLLDACRHGIFANHPGRYRLRVVDAATSLTRIRDDPALSGCIGAPFRAVFLNYVLDCLPAAVFRLCGDDVLVLCIRTYLARSAQLSDQVGREFDGLVASAAGNDRYRYKDLARLYDSLALEYDYQPRDIDAIPYSELVVSLAKGRVNYVLNNYAAIQCLEQLHGMLTDNGLILINEFGHPKLEDSAEKLEPQRFSGSSAVGINFYVVGECLKKLGVSGWVEPDQPEAAEVDYLSRLIVKCPSSNVVKHFKASFGPKSFEQDYSDAQQARAYAEQGRHELAVIAYEAALARQPWNWVLMDEIAKFVALTLGDVLAALDICRVALALNPTGSSSLWNTFGECLDRLGKQQQAQEAFTRAARLNPADARSYFNLARSSLRDREYSGALRAVAEGLTAAVGGASVNAFLSIQSQVIDELRRRRDEQERLRVDRLSRAAATNEDALSHSLSPSV